MAASMAWNGSTNANEATFVQQNAMVTHRRLQKSIADNSTRTRSSGSQAHNNCDLLERSLHTQT